jgi:hypothetical protein
MCRRNILPCNLSIRYIVAEKICLLYTQPCGGLLVTIFWGGGGSGLSTNMRPYNVTLDKRGHAEGTSRAPQARAERRRREVFLGGSGGRVPRKVFKFRVPEMPFPGIGGRFDRNLMFRKRYYNVSKFAIWLEFSSST